MKNLRSVLNKRCLGSKELHFVKAGMHLGFTQPAFEFNEVEDSTPKPNLNFCLLASQWIRLMANNVNNLLNGIATLLENPRTTQFRQPS